MSKEAIPQLSSESKELISSLPPDLRATSEERILALSHTALHSMSVVGNRPIPKEKLSEEHLPHINRVNDLMKSSSEILGAAYGEINDDSASFEDLTDKAIEIALRSAKGAKESQDDESSVVFLESLLAIATLKEKTTDGYSKKLAREIISQGLSTELIKATHNSFGIVANNDGRLTPLNSVANNSRDLLRATSPLDFDYDFSEIETKEPDTDLSKLGCGDLTVLASLADKDSSLGLASKDVMILAVRKMKIEEVDADDFTKALIAADEIIGKCDELESSLSSLRTRRKSGAGNYRINDWGALRLDAVIFNLTQQGHYSLAEGLLSSSSNEADNFESYVPTHGISDEDTAKTLKKIADMRAEKEQKLVVSMKNNGANDDTIAWIIGSTIDPDSATGIKANFWAQLENNSSLRELLLPESNNLLENSLSLTKISDLGLEKYSQTLLSIVNNIGDEGIKNKYLTSFKEAEAILSKINENGAIISNMESILRQLASFEDPVMAIRAAKDLFGEDEYLKNIYNLQSLVHPDYLAYAEIIAFSQNNIDALINVRNYISETGLDPSFLSFTAKTISKSDDPIARSKIIISSLEIAKSVFQEDQNIIYQIIDKENLFEISKALSEINAAIISTNESLRQSLNRKIFDSLEPEKTAQLMIKTQNEIIGQNIALDEMKDKDFFDAMIVVANADDPKEVVRFCSNWKVKKEGEIAYGKFWGTAAEGGLEKLDPLLLPTLKDYPELSARFNAIGISPELAEDIFNSWNTKSELKRLLYNDDRTVSETKPEDIQYALPMQAERLIPQIEALEKHISEYGFEETKKIIDIFGIFNFSRYSDEILHDQLKQWENSEITVKNIVVTAKSDWNGALDSTGKPYESLLENEGTFYFEVNDRIQLARVAVSVGNRERSMGRNPEQESQLKNFIINAHASPDGILLGVNGDRLSVEDYLEEPLNGAKANTYKRHLGSNYRVILKACSTAGEVKDGKNIAESISDGHEVRVEGSNVLTYGSISIDPDGNISFNGGKVRAIVYE